MLVVASLFFKAFVLFNAKRGFMLTKHQALVYCMVVTSAADNDMTDAELMKMREIVSVLPVFDEYDEEELPTDAGKCAELLMEADGFDHVLDLVRESLPPNLRETAYALSVDVAAADLHAAQEELRLLMMIRHKLDIDRLIAAGIERGARARYTRG